MSGLGNEPMLVRMGMYVDEPRRKRKSVACNPALTITLGQLTDEGDAITICRDISDECRSSTPIIDARSLENVGEH